MRITYSKNIGGKDENFDMLITRELNYFTISCLSKNDEEMGYASFKIYNNYLWLYKIETYNNFQHQGIASAIIDLMEYIAIKKM